MVVQSFRLWSPSLSLQRVRSVLGTGQDESVFEVMSSPYEVYEEL